MNRKALQKTLLKKHDQFVKSIKDAKVRRLVNKNSIITGGAIASGLLGEEINDYDYYFTDKETCIAVANYYLKEFIDLNPHAKVRSKVVEHEDDRVKILIAFAGIAGEVDPVKLDAVQTISEFDNLDSQESEKEKNPAYRPIFLTSNAITLSNQVQLVIRFYGDPDEIHKNYDFTHCTNYWLSSDASLHLNQDALESLLSKHLRYSGSLYPVSSVIRTRKFLKRGWHINAGQYIKMVFQISEIDLSDIKVLEDQLIGVDCAYFFEVIDNIKKRQANDPAFKLDSTYLVSIIDKIF